MFNTISYREFIKEFGLEVFLSVVEAGEVHRVHLADHGVDTEYVTADVYDEEYSTGVEWFCEWEPEECTFMVWCEVDEIGECYPCDDVDTACEVFQEWKASEVAEYQAERKMERELDHWLGW